MRLTYEIFTNMNRSYIKALLATIIVFTSSFPSYANLTADVTPASGPWVPDGAIDLTVSGGFSPYEYLWTDNAGGILSAQEDISNLLPGTYHITVTDALCGAATLEVEVGYDCGLTIENLAPHLHLRIWRCGIRSIRGKWKLRLCLGTYWGGRLQ